MIDGISIRSMLNSIVPISRFNKGEAKKIFDEVKSVGYKIVVKNNNPTCVLLSPEKYQEMMGIIENYYLLEEAEGRMESLKANDFTTHEDVLKELGVDEDDLNDIEVEIQ